MKYVRKNIEGKWCTVKLTNEEFFQILLKALNFNIKIMENLIKKSENKFTEQQIVAIFYKIAPNIYDFINDYVEEKILEEGKTMNEQAVEKVFWETRERENEGN